MLERSMTKEILDTFDDTNVVNHLLPLPGSTQACYSVGHQSSQKPSSTHRATPNASTGIGRGVLPLVLFSIHSLTLLCAKQQTEEETHDRQKKLTTDRSSSRQTEELHDTDRDS